MKSRHWLVRLTEAQLRVVDYALFDFIESSTPGAMRTLGYSKAVAERAHEALLHARVEQAAWSATLVRR